MSSMYHIEAAIVVPITRTWIRTESGTESHRFPDAWCLEDSIREASNIGRSPLHRFQGVLRRGLFPLLLKDARPDLQGLLLPLVRLGFELRLLGFVVLELCVLAVKEVHVEHRLVVVRPELDRPVELGHSKVDDLLPLLAIHLVGR